MSSGGIIHNLPDRKKRDDRTMDQFEEHWFEGDDEEEMTDEMTAYDEAPSKQQLVPAEELHDETSNSTRPLSAKLKDVDLLDSVPINRRTDSPPLSNGPSTNNRSPVGIPRPISPVNNTSSLLSFSKEQQEQSQHQQEQDAVFAKTLNNKSVITNRTLVNNKFMNNKPKMQIKINSTNLTDNKRPEEAAEIEESPKNGVMSPGNEDIENGATLNHVNSSVKMKPVCIILFICFLTFVFVFVFFFRSLFFVSSVIKLTAASTHTRRS